MSKQSTFLVALMVLWCATAVQADQREFEVETYLANLDPASWPAPPSPLLAVESGTDPEAEDPTRHWHGAIELWLWAPLYGSGSISARTDTSLASATQRSLAAPLDDFLSFDIDDFSGYLVPLRSVWWKGRWGILFEVSYADLNPKGTLLGQLQVPWDLELQYWFVDLAATFFALHPEIDEQPWTISFFAGVRYIDMKQTLTVGTLPTETDSQTEFAPVLGFGLEYHFSKRFSLLLREDVSGGGISGSDVFMFNAELGGIVRIGKKYHLLLHFGWRLELVDFASGVGDSDLVLDYVLHGPFLGIGYNF